MNTRQMENQKRILAAKYGVKKSQITDKDVETYRSETNKEGAKQGAGIVGVGGAGVLANKSKDKGYLSGRRTVYHTTEKKNVPSIKEHGLKPFGKNDTEAGFTNRALSYQRQLGFIDDNADKPAVYLAKNKKVARSIINGKKMQSVLNYIKHNPKRFAKGLGIYGLVGTGATVGGKAIVDAQREANKLKTLEGLRNKAKQEKQKKEAFEYINELYMEKVASLQIY